MLILKVEQNLFEELGRLPAVIEERKGESIWRSLEVDFCDGVTMAAVEKRKYPYFYKYYLYLQGNLEEAVSLKEEKGARFLLAFYHRFCPDYVKNPLYDETIGMKPEVYFHMEKIPGETMQHFIPGKGSAEEVRGPEKKGAQGYRALDGFHEFSQKEKEDMGGQLDALKNQFADQLKELEALLGKKAETK